MFVAAVILVAMSAGSCVAGPEAKVEKPVHVPEVIQRLREPLTKMPLSTLFRNMQDHNEVKYYVECVTEKGPCDNIGRALRHVVLDQRQSGLCYGCDRCQTERVRYVLDTIESQYPQLACDIETSLQWRGLFSSQPCRALPSTS